MEEIWKDIPGYEGLYQVSNFGRVRSLDKIVVMRSKGSYPKKGIVLSPMPNPNDYLTVSLYKDRKLKRALIHHLVAEAFLNHKKGSFSAIIDHKDENKQNNKLSNLQIISTRKNLLKSRDKELTTSKHNGVHFDKSIRVWKAGISIGKDAIYLGSSRNNEKKIARLYDIAAKNIHLYEGCKKSFKEKISSIERNN